MMFLCILDPAIVYNSQELDSSGVITEDLFFPGMVSVPTCMFPSCGLKWYGFVALKPYADCMCKQALL